MIKKILSLLPYHTRVLFELPAAIWADRIFVVGNFGEGPPSRTPLTQERDGVWRARIDLPDGHPYHFRYWVDGAWHTDSHADGFATTADGCHTSLIKMN